VLLMTKADDAVTTVASLYFDFGFVQEHDSASAIRP
jgi:hypothetical protein